MTDHLYIIAFTLMFGMAMFTSIIFIVQYFTEHEVTLQFNNFHESMFEATLGFVCMCVFPIIWYITIKQKATEDKYGTRQARSETGLKAGI